MAPGQSLIGQGSQRASPTGVFTGAGRPWGIANDLSARAAFGRATATAGWCVHPNAKCATGPRRVRLAWIRPEVMGPRGRRVHAAAPAVTRPSGAAERNTSARLSIRNNALPCPGWTPLEKQRRMPETSAGGVRPVFVGPVGASIGSRRILQAMRKSAALRSDGSGALMDTTISRAVQNPRPDQVPSNAPGAGR